MIDVIAAIPGACPTEVENLLTRPIERRMWEIPGVEYVYGMAGEGMTLVTVRFKVGEDQEPSGHRVLRQARSAAMDRAPPGALPPLVKPHSIDDVPILTLTLHGDGYGSNALRDDGARTSRTSSAPSPTSPRHSCHRRGAAQFQVTLDPARLAASGVTPGEVMLALRAPTSACPPGSSRAANQVFLVSVGAPLTHRGGRRQRGRERANRAGRSTSGTWPTSRRRPARRPTT